MVEAAWRPLARTGVRPDWIAHWMEPFARTIDAARKYVVSSTLDQVWTGNAELVCGDHLETAVHELKQQPGKGLFVGGVKLPAGFVGPSFGLIDEYEFIVQPSSGPRADIVRGIIEVRRFEARGSAAFGSGAASMRYVPRRRG